MSFKNFQSVHPYEADSSRKLYGKDDFEDEESSEDDLDLDDAISKINFLCSLVFTNLSSWGKNYQFFLGYKKFGYIPSVVSFDFEVNFQGKKRN